MERPTGKALTQAGATSDQKVVETAERGHQSAQLGPSFGGVPRGSFGPVKDLNTKIRAFSEVERPLPPVRLDQDRRTDPQEGQPIGQALTGQAAFR